MLSIVIPTLNEEATLVRTLSSLVEGAVRGLVRDVVVADGGSTDETAAIADDAGATWIAAKRGRGAQLEAGAAEARGEWLLFLHADTVLAAGWVDEVAAFIESPGAAERAAVFRFALDDFSAAARRLESIVRWRCKILALPYGDQGLLIHRRLYDRLGGYEEMPLMEDVDFVRRIGRRRLVYLRTEAVTSADRYQRDGYLARMVRNAFLLSLFFVGFSPERLVRHYD